MRREIRGHMANVDDEDETVWSFEKSEGKHGRCAAIW